MNKQFFCPIFSVFHHNQQQLTQIIESKLAIVYILPSFFSIHEMTQPPGAVIKAATDGRVSKGGFLPAGAWFVPVGARIKREYW